MATHQISEARNENVKISASNDTENLNPDIRHKNHFLISKFIRYPWTESTEFVEMWSDIPSRTGDHIQADQEQKISESGDTNLTVSNTRYSNNDSSVIFWVKHLHPWTESKEFVELWSDKPRGQFDISPNRFEDQEEMEAQNEVASSQNATTLSEDMIYNKQCLTTTGIFSDSFVDSENLTEVSSVAPEDSRSNQNYSVHQEEENMTCCSQFCECFREFQHFAMSFRKTLLFFLVQVLLSLIPISATCMGLFHVGTCPANEGATHLVYMAGMAGVILIGFHIAHHLTNNNKEQMRFGIRVFQAIAAILLTIEMFILYSMSPSFENSENYCDETFYNYTFYMNIAAAGILFPSVLLQYTSF